MKGSYLLKKRLFSSLQVRWTSSVKYKLQDNIKELIDRQIIKPKKHPGIIPYKESNLPKWIITEMVKHLKSVDTTDFKQKSLKYSNYLHSRHLPLEDNKLQETDLNVKKSVLQHKLDLLKDEIQTKNQLSKHTTLNALKNKAYRWKPIEYNKLNSILHMYSRSAPEYSVLMTIFNEIKTRDKDFNPQTLFDFGSGVGSVFWAATNTWNNINEYMGIDISNDINDLCQKIISQSPLKVKGIFHRQYLPMSNISYDIVVSAYSFMELPNITQRLEIICRLWKKTNKYLVIIEQGTNAGFRVMNEAREIIKYMTQNTKFKSNYFIFAPCPHKMGCPRFAEGQTPCNFISQYILPFFKSSKHNTELFSYLVFKKGEPTETDNWSRIVRSSIARSRQVNFNICTTSGKLENVTFSKKHQTLYQCAKKTGWGDRLPIEPDCACETSLENTEKKDAKILEESSNELNLKDEVQAFDSEISIDK